MAALRVVSVKIELREKMYKLEDLENARAEARKWGDAFANERSNNPNVYLAERRDAGIKVRRIESYLKEVGIIEKTDDEILTEKLDALYPNARSKTIVNFEGKRYQVSYFL